jgi:AcrR family transcriptional regulator
MIKTSGSSPWREARRRSGRDVIVAAAWALAREEGLAGWSLRDLARRAGISTPTVYAYFDSKNAIYDAMFGEAAAEFEDRMAEPFHTEDPRDQLVVSSRRYAQFCLSDLVRYQLLFQRTLPGFEPSPQSYAPAVRALQAAGEFMARNGITAAPHLGLWTALLTGLVSQQIANDPGGDRWTRLIDESVTMFLGHCQQAAQHEPESSPGQIEGGPL